MLVATRSTRRKHVDELRLIKVDFFGGFWMEKNRSCLGDLLGTILPSIIGIKIIHYKDPHEPTSISWNVTRVLITVKGDSRDSQAIGTPSGKRDPYYSHIFRDSYGSGMGIV